MVAGHAEVRTTKTIAPKKEKEKEKEKGKEKEREMERMPKEETKKANQEQKEEIGVIINKDGTKGIIGTHQKENVK